jgi:hypothetical protein
LNELLEQCRQSGIDPEEHPEVVRIRDKLATDCPDAAKPLLKRQEAIELELLRTMERWYGSFSRDALSRLIAMTLQIRDKSDPNAAARTTQDPTAHSLLVEYARINDKIIDILANEGD